MKLDNRLGQREILLTKASGTEVRVTLPEGKFDLPQSYVDLMEAHPVGKFYLKKMKPRKARKDASIVKSEDNQEQESPADS